MPTTTDYIILVIIVLIVIFLLNLTIIQQTRIQALKKQNEEIASNNTILENKNDVLEQKLQNYFKQLPQFNINDEFKILNEKTIRTVCILDHFTTYKVIVDDGAPMLLNEKELQSIMLKQEKVFSYKNYINDIYKQNSEAKIPIQTLLKILERDGKPVKDLEAILAIDPDWCEYRVIE